MTCEQCKNWRLAGPLAEFGYGTCDARQVAGHTTSGKCICRIGRFIPIKPKETPNG